MDAVLSQLASAIHSLKRVHLHRTSDPPGSHRTVEPHVIFQSETGRLLVDVFQTDGFSKSGRLPGWRALQLEELDHLTTTAEFFEPRWADGYNPSNRRKYPVILHQISAKIPFDSRRPRSKRPT